MSKVYSRESKPIDIVFTIMMPSRILVPVLPVMPTRQAAVNSHLRSMTSIWAKQALTRTPACHTTFDFDEIDIIHLKCIECHGGYETVAELTKTANETINPHVSHFPKLQCTQCHVAHGEFHDFCNTCHNAGFKWTPKRK